MCMNKHWSQTFSIALIFALMLSLAPGFSSLVQAISTGVVISQVYGGGGNTGAPYKNDYVELFNRGTSPVSLSGWSVQYASATGTGNFGNNPIASLSGTLQPGQYYLVQLAGGTNGIALPPPDASGTANMSSTGGKVALVNTTTGLACNGSVGQPCSSADLAKIIDLVGWDGANFYETAPAPTTSNSNSIFRNNNGCTETDNNSADFTAGTPAPRNTASPKYFCTADAAPYVASTLPANGAVEVPLNSDVTVTFSENVNVAGSWFGLSCASSGTHTATVTGGPTSFTLNPSSDFVSGESCTLTVYAANVTDQDLIDPPDNMTINFTAGFTTVAPPLPIGTVNGVVLDTDNGITHVSPYVGQTVTIQGVIYEKTLQAISNSSNTYKGFYIQNTSATADGNPRTSDGLFVFMSTSSTISGPSGPYTPMVGDEIVLSGKVSEYFNMTELVSPLTVKAIVRTGVDIEAEIPPVVADPQAGLADANRYWERLQGMRVQVPQNSIVLGGRNVFNPADAEIWVASPDSTIALRTDPYTRRAFRDAHPLDDNYDAINWDGNGYRILMGSLGIKGAAGNAQALIDPARTFDTVTNSPSGGLNYTFSKYRIEITTQPVLNDGPNPTSNHPPQAFNRGAEYSIADYNLENLYDYRDNPFSGCDFTGNSGCPKVDPFLAAINPPYDYVPASDAAYQARLNDIANQIINDLHSPDILMVQEVENQDICTVTDGALTCGAADNADGKPDVLQELALKIATLGGPSYDAAFDRNSSDLRGIAPSFMYRTDRVVLLPPDGDPVLGMSPAIGSYTAVPYDNDVSNPKTLNAVYAGTGACETSWVFPRAPDVGLFRIYNVSVGTGNYRDVYVINNHFKSGPDTCVA
ncbi:MAG: lamin tail domain-containing protein, partial [Chloroflexi bacterium]|nr:lamin tail domain-containing protein [Chloroflexota bacterium]